MRFSIATAVVSAAALTTAQVGVSGDRAPNGSDYTPQEIADGTAFRNVSEVALENMQYNIGRRKNAPCTFEQAKIRQEWRTLPPSTRKSFTDAVLCLQSLPPQVMTPDLASTYPGVKSRFDEYVATHINYTFNIHVTADFLAYHRAFIHFLEKDLQTQCGYTGVLPYWNWAMDAEAPQDSPLFTGDAYSMGTNGKVIPNRKNIYLYAQETDMPPGTGGGCVHSGPFSNTTVNMGPLDSPTEAKVDTPFQHNPRCLIRDFNPFFTKNYNTYTNVTSLILDNIYIQDFQNLMQGYGSTTNKFGVHGGGHWAGGGSILDFHSSPSDPLFYLHHGMIDRTWTIWQNLDIYRRQNVISGTGTIANSPASPEMTLDDELPMGFVTDEKVVFRDYMDTFAGALCYRYD